MPKALFFNIPAHGHINPSLPLVAELVRRGHEITYFTTPHFRQRVAATGATVQLYEGVEDNYFEAHGLDGSIPQLAELTLLKTTQTLLPSLLDEVKRAKLDYLLYDCMCPWGYFVGQVTKLPTVSSSSLMILSPRMLLDWQVLRVLAPLVRRGLRSGMAANRLSKQIGKRYHVQPLTSINTLNAPADVVIGYSSAEYVPFAAKLPDHVKLVGWTFQEHSAAEPFEHTSERPLIYISLGTVSNKNAQFFNHCIAALRESPYDVLISTGGGIAPEAFGPLPAHITIKDWVPQSQVLRQAALFITHGGLNSLHDGLYCGLPLLIVPQQSEQTINALMAVRHGVGRMLRSEQMQTTMIRASIDELLENPSYRAKAQQLGASFRTGGGMPKAADEIEALLERKH